MKQTLRQLDPESSVLEQEISLPDAELVLGLLSVVKIDLVTEICPSWDLEQDPPHYGYRGVSCCGKRSGTLLTLDLTFVSPGGSLVSLVS